MSRILSMLIEGGVLQIRLRAYIDVRTGETETMRALIREGLSRIEAQGPYDIGGMTLPVKMSVEEAERFSPFVLNIRVYDKTPVIRSKFSFRMNVSRAYFGARRTGLWKLTRALFGMSDVFINLAGRDISSEAGRISVASVVQHEFGHVLGFRDKYRQKTGAPKNDKVAPEDLMYKTGSRQRFMPYQIKRLYECAKKGRLIVLPV